MNNKLFEQVKGIIRPGVPAALFALLGVNIFVIPLITFFFGFDSEGYYKSVTSGFKSIPENIWDFMVVIYGTYSVSRHMDKSRQDKKEKKGL